LETKIIYDKNAIKIEMYVKVSNYFLALNVQNNFKIKNFY